MDSCPYVLIPQVSIHPHFIAVSKTPHWLEGRKHPRRKKMKLPDSNETNGLVSDRAASKIKKAINWLLLLANDKELVSSYHGKAFKFKLSFITLTLSSKQIHSDNEIKEKCLNQFLVEARTKWGLKHYLWRAEAQANGNIHFHILCDKFIPWSELRDVWNRIQGKLGYVERYRDEMRQFHAGGFNVRQNLLEKWSYKKQLRAYRTGSRQDWNSPNSSDVHSVVNVSDLPSYLSKYCTKNDPRRSIDGRLWGLSQSLSRLKGAIDIIDSSLSDELNSLCIKFPDKVINKQYYSILLVSVAIWSKVQRGSLYAMFCNYLYDAKHNSS